jgi:hypothetical protein
MVAQTLGSETYIEAGDRRIVLKDLLEILLELQGSCECSRAGRLDRTVYERRRWP